MKKMILAMLAAAFCATISAQQTVEIDGVEPFTAAAFTGNVSVELIKAERPSMEVKLYDADIKHLKWDVADGKLTVSMRSPQIKKGMAEIRVSYVGDLRDVSINKGTLTITGPLETPMATLSAGGGAKLVGKVATTDLELEVTGNSVAFLEGETKYLTLRATERSKVDMRRVSAVSVEVEAATVSEATVSASERLVANAKTGSTIFYQGAPAVFRDRSSRFSTSVGSGVISID